MKTIYRQQGFVLITTMMMLSVLAALLGAYLMVTKIELASTKSSKDGVSGFFAAEAGLNIRAEEVRVTFVGYNRPTGTTPSSTDPCTGSNLGSGDFRCKDYSFTKRTSKTYIAEDPSNPVILTIPPGERYQNLNAQEYRYTATSKALSQSNATEALLDLRFKSRLVPLFQFAAFYNKDLEILPGPAMTLSGPIHTNGDLYLNANTSLDISGQVTTAKKLYRGRKDNSTSPNCSSTPVRIKDPVTALALKPTCTSRTLISATDVVPYHNMIQFGVEPVTVPGPEVFDATPGALYWDKADLRLVLRLDASNNPILTNSVSGVEVRNADNSVNTTATNQLNTCAGNITSAGGINNRAVGTPVTRMYNVREAKLLRILDVDILGTLNCLKTTNWFGSGKALNDATEGGIIIHLSVSGPDSAIANRYGVRVGNAARIYSTAGGAPAIKGMTIVSDQAAYVWGHFNRDVKIPAAIMADSLNVLSPAWTDSKCTGAGVGAGQPCNYGNRNATSATINAAFLAGTDSTGGIEGSGGQGGAYNGGLENYPRFHENWSGQTLTYRGSFVSLGTPRHVSGGWGAQSYSPPARDWNYDTSFNNAANLPPITPRFVYLRQELFVRQFEL